MEHIIRKYGRAMPYHVSLKWMCSIYWNWSIDNHQNGVYDDYIILLMELEKTLYRVHDRLLFNTNASKIVLIAMTFLFSVGMCGLLMFMILNNTKDG
jgi:hypothetical protein